MPTARKDVADRLNDAALSAANTLISISNGEVSTGEAQVRVAAARIILNKVVPDLKATELSGKVETLQQVVTVGEYEAGD